MPSSARASDPRVAHFQLDEHLSWVVRVANVLHQHNGFFNPYFLYFARELVLGGLE
jgi:hypothetical protein